MRPTPLERFEQKFIPSTSGCWTWTAGLSDKGYGRFTLGKEQYAHRASWIFYHGNPGALDVLHRCDNPKCVNPNHLFLGTHTDNMHDMIRKGRHRPRGGSKDSAFCKHGHMFDKISSNRPYCSTCRRARKERQCTL